MPELGADSDEYMPMADDEVREWMFVGPIENRLDTAETGDLMMKLKLLPPVPVGPCPPERTPKMQPGDEALIFRGHIALSAAAAPPGERLPRELSLLRRLR